jgi:precorrin-2 dehydrogenase/sirohydrochlorin ferrochelatase
MKYYPVFLDLRGRPCLVVGGGTVAERKAVSLLDAGADLTIVSPSLTPALRELVHRNKVRHRPKVFEEPDLTRFFLAIAATNNPTVNTTIAAACRARGVLVNVATAPEASAFIVPSVVERGDLMIAVSTCGASPALAKKVREDLEHAYGPEYGVFTEKLALLRQRLLAVVPSETARRQIFQAVVDSDVLDLIRQGAVREADLRIEEVVKSRSGAGGG